MTGKSFKLPEPSLSNTDKRIKKYQKNQRPNILILTQLKSDFNSSVFSKKKYFRVPILKFYFSIHFFKSLHPLTKSKCKKFSLNPVTFPVLTMSLVLLIFTISKRWFSESPFTNLLIFFFFSGTFQDIVLLKKTHIATLLITRFRLAAHWGYARNMLCDLGEKTGFFSVSTCFFS